MICDVQRVRKWLCQATVSGHRNARRREAVWRQFVAVDDVRGSCIAQASAHHG